MTHAATWAQKMSETGEPELQDARFDQLGAADHLLVIRNIPASQIRPSDPDPVEFEALEDSKTVVSEGSDSGGEESTLTEPPSLVDIPIEPARPRLNRPSAKSLLRPKAEVRRPRPVHPTDARGGVLAAKAEPRPSLDARSGVLASKGKGSKGEGSSEGKQNRPSP